MAHGTANVATQNERPHFGTPDNVRTLDARRRDMKLVQSVVAGDPGAFDRLHAQYRDRVFAFALKRLRDAAEADDVCQDVFLQIFRCIDTFQGRSSLLTWIFGITHHQICRRLRKRRLETYSLDDADAFEVAGEAVPVERCLDAARALDDCGRLLEERVSESQREVFRLHYAENQSTRDIAEKLGKSRQAVKISLFRTRRTLSSEMESRGIPLTAA